MSVTGINNTGYYDFTIKNYNKNGISDVPMNYSIEVISNTDDSISFKLYKDKKEVALKNNKTKKIYLKNLSKQEHAYRLEVVYDRTKSNSQKDILENVQIKVHSEQAKA